MMVLVDLVALVSLLGCVLVGLSFSSPAILAFLLLLFFGYRYGMEGKAWVNNYRNFAQRKTQRGKQVGVWGRYYQPGELVCQARPPADAGFLSPSVQAQAQLTQQHQHPGGVVNLF